MLRDRRYRLLAACASIFAFAPLSRGAVVINEFIYDDGGTDDRTFVELYNTDLVNPALIGGWTLGGQDGVGANTTVTITAGATIPAGGYYVIGMTGVTNVNQVVADAWENDSETIELKNAGVLQDALVYESFRGNNGTTGHGALPGPVAAQVGPGYFPIHNPNDIGVAVSTGTASTVGRYLNGRDTNNNGRDFGLRRSTPGASNTTGGTMSVYTPPDPTGQAVGTDLNTQFGWSFVNPRVINPTVADANNPNAITPAPNTGNRAIIAWDPSGGGNVATSAATFNTGASSFDIHAYLDTRDLPLSFNASNVTFRGSEFTFYGIGGGDNSTALVDISGQVGLAGGTLPSADTSNGFTGVFWLYEKVGETSTGAGDVSEKLYLIDGNDGGDASTGGNTALDWIILETIDLSTISSNWFDLGISIDAAGNGTAHFNGTTYNFTTVADLVGAFNVGYRENTQAGADGTPEANLRPPTFTLVPEPASLGVICVGGIMMLGRRRRR